MSDQHSSQHDYLWSCRKLAHLFILKSETLKPKFRYWVNLCWRHRSLNFDWTEPCGMLKSNCCISGYIALLLTIEYLHQTEVYWMCYLGTFTGMLNSLPAEWHLFGCITWTCDLWWSKWVRNIPCNNQIMAPCQFLHFAQTSLLSFNLYCAAMLPCKISNK